MDNCVTHKAVKLIKAIIAFTFMAMLSTLCAFILDLVGPTQRSLKCIHRNAIFSIISGKCPLMCVIQLSLCGLNEGIKILKIFKKKQLMSISLYIPIMLSTIMININNI